MKRTKLIFSVLLIVGICTGLLFGCGKKDASSSEAQPQNETADSRTAADFVKMLSESGECDILDASAVYGSELFDGSCEKLYGTEAANLLDGAIMYVSSGETADEISLIKLQPTSSADVLSILEERKKSRYSDFEGYNPNELEKIENAEIFKINGGFGVLIISDDTDKIKALIGQDGAHE